MSQGKSLRYPIINAYMDFVNCPKHFEEIQWLSEMEYHLLVEELKRNGKFFIKATWLWIIENGAEIAVLGGKIVPRHPTVFWAMAKNDPECLHAIDVIQRIWSHRMSMNRENIKLVVKYSCLLRDQVCIDEKMRLTRGFRHYLQENGIFLNLM